MATQTKKSARTTKTTKSTASANRVADSADRVDAVNKEAVDGLKKLGVAYVNTYEKVGHSFADSVQQAGEVTKVDWFASVTSAQADIVRELTSAYAGSARRLVS